VLAELKEWYPASKDDLRRWNMRESQTVNEWKREGRVETLRQTLRDLLEDRFGSLSGEWLARIEAVADPGRLRQAVRQVLKLKNLDDLSL
jgi:hypothetical protein